MKMHKQHKTSDRRVWRPHVDFDLQHGCVGAEDLQPQDLEPRVWSQALVGHPCRHSAEAICLDPISARAKLKSNTNHCVFGLSYPLSTRWQVAGYCHAVQRQRRLHVQGPDGGGAALAKVKDIRIRMICTLARKRGVCAVMVHTTGAAVLVRG